MTQPRMFEWWKITINYKVPVYGESTRTIFVKEADLIDRLKDIGGWNIESYQVASVMLPKDPETEKSDELDS